MHWQWLPTAGAALVLLLTASTSASASVSSSGSAAADVNSTSTTPALTTTATAKRECSFDELFEMNDQFAPGSAFYSACSMLPNNDFHVDTVAELSTTQLTRIAECKAPRCVEALRGLRTGLPDCAILGDHLRTDYAVVLTMCEQFAVGPVTQAELVTLFKQFEPVKTSPPPPTTTPPPTPSSPRETPEPALGSTPCAPRELEKAEKKHLDDVQDDCKDTHLSVSSYALDYSYGAQVRGVDNAPLQKMCLETKCIDAVRALFIAYPNCAVDGANIKDKVIDSYAAFERECAMVGVAIVPLVGWPSSSAAVATAPTLTWGLTVVATAAVTMRLA